MIEDDKNFEIPQLFHGEVENIKSLLDPIEALLQQSNSDFDPAADALDEFRHRYVWLVGKVDDREALDYAAQLGEALMIFIGEKPLADGKTINSLIENFPELDELVMAIDGVDPNLLPKLRKGFDNIFEACDGVLPALVESCHQLAKKAEAHLNYHKIFEDNYESGTQHIYDFLNTVSLPILEEEDNFWDAFWLYKGWFENYLGMMGAMASENDNWLESAPELPDDLTAQRELVASAHGFTDQFWDNQALCSTYKIQIAREEWKDDLLDKPGIQLALHFSRRNKATEPVLDENKYAIQALAEILGEELAQLAQDGAISREGEVYAHEQIMFTELPFAVEGLEPKAGFTTITNENFLKLYLVGQSSGQYLFPGYFLEGIGKIRFIPPEDSIQMIDGDRIGVASLRNVSSNFIYEIMYHEIFESFMGKLTFDEMKGFDEALIIDKKEHGVDAITLYVRRKRLDFSGSDGERLSKKEDFCESAAFFAKKPYDLYVSAPARYEFMLNFFASHLPIKEQQQFKSEHRLYMGEQKRRFNGDTGDDGDKAIRETLLAHQELSDAEVVEVRMVTGGVSTPEKNEGEGETIDILYPVYFPNQA